MRVRGLGLQLSTPNGKIRRSAMIDPPIFTVSTPEGFYELQLATHSKDPNAMKAFVTGHPEFDPFAEWAKTTPWVASYAEETYNSLNSFIFVSGSGAEHAVRWSLVPQAQVVQITQEDLAKLGPELSCAGDHGARRQGPPTLDNGGDGSRSGRSHSRPKHRLAAGRRAVEVGTLVVQRIEGERDGPCRDINFDPTILPNGVHVSDDPFPSARSAAYAVSYDLRTSELKYYPYHSEAAGGRER